MKSKRKRKRVHRTKVQLKSKLRKIYAAREHNRNLAIEQNKLREPERRMLDQEKAARHARHITSCLLKKDVSRDEYSKKSHMPSFLISRLMAEEVKRKLTHGEKKRLDYFRANYAKKFKLTGKGYVPR